MPRRIRRRIRRRSRGRERRRPSKFTPVRLLKLAIALTPVTAKAIDNANTAGGLGTSTGWSKGVLPTISTSYAGYNPNDGKFYMNDLAVGYVPLVAAWAFGKVASRVLRL